MILEDLVELLTDGHRPRAGRALGILSPLHFVPALEDVDQAPASLREQLDALDAKRLQLAVAKPRVEGRGSQSSVPLLEGVDHLYRHVRGNDPLRLVAEAGSSSPESPTGLVDGNRRQRLLVHVHSDHDFVIASYRWGRPASGHELLGCPGRQPLVEAPPRIPGAASRRRIRASAGSIRRKFSRRLWASSAI